MSSIFVVVTTSVLATILMLISLVDARRMIIPDGLNVVLALTGLIFRAIMTPGSLVFSVAFSALVFLALWCLRLGHARWTGRIGLGLGDVKMLAASACWIDPLFFPLLLFIASFSALMFVGGRVAMIGWCSARERVAFGPFIALGMAGSWATQQFLATAGQT